MTRRRMNNLYEALSAIGLLFDETEFLHWDKFFGGDGALNVKGFLFNQDETPLTEEQLTKVLQLAKSKKTYCVVLTESAAGKGEVVACFLQLELFHMVEDTLPTVLNALRQHFCYFQEDEKALGLGAALQQLSEDMEFFRKKAHNIAHLPDASNRFRIAVREAGKRIQQAGALDQYMRNGMERSLAEALCKAINCMQLID